VQLLDMLEFFALVALTAALTRFVRQGQAVAGFRRWLASVSSLASALLRCAHCLSFWIALGLTVLLGVIRNRLDDPIGWIEGPLFVILGWRGAFYINRQLDQRAQDSTAAVRMARKCAICDKPFTEGFLERHGLYFCTLQCWFSFLKERPTSYNKLFTPAGEFIRQEIYPMSYRDIASQEAHDLLESDAGYRYIDVRSTGEFTNGHPAGAVNIPIAHREELGMVPNPDFLKVVDINFERDDKLIVGCQSGGRSMRAAEALIAAGFTDVANVRGGFGGARNEGGEVLEKGWFELGLPVEYGESEGRTYAARGGSRQG